MEPEVPELPETNPKEGADSTLFEQVYHRYRRVLLKYFHRQSVRPAEVEELVQETYLRLLAHPQGAALDHAQGYLFTIAANIANDWHRSRLIREGLTAAVLPTQRCEGSEPIDAERIIIAREEAQRVAAVLGRLPERTHDIFLLNRFEQIPYRTLARHYNTTVAEVRKHMSIALRTLDEAIDVKGHTNTDSFVS